MVMRIKLKIGTDLLKDGWEIYEVINDLEQHLGRNIPHERMTMHDFFVGKGWSIDHCVDHWEVRLDARTARKPWAVAFKMKWT